MTGPTLLRRLAAQVDAKTRSAHPGGALAVAAYRFLRIGGTVPIDADLSEAEVLALEAAAELLDLTRAQQLASVLSDGGAEASAPFDGGARRVRAALERTAERAARLAGSVT